MRTPRRMLTYVVVLERASGCGDLQNLAQYLSDLDVAGCDVVVLDACPEADFAEHRRTLRWVARHVAQPPGTDLLRAAADAARCEKVVLATPAVRVDFSALDRLRLLLELHEVVEAEDRSDSTEWWDRLDRSRLLLQRAIDPSPGRGSAFAFRRSIVRTLRRPYVRGEHPVKRMFVEGVEVHAAVDLPARVGGSMLADWLRERPALAERDLHRRGASAFFLAMLPIAIVLAVLTGPSTAASYLAAVAVGSVVLAAHGLRSTGADEPVGNCLLAPLWVAERSVSVYFALARRLRSAALEPTHPVTAPASGKKVAQG